MLGSGFCLDDFLWMYWFFNFGYFFILKNIVSIFLNNRSMYFLFSKFIFSIFFYLNNMCVRLLIVGLFGILKD